MISSGPQSTIPVFSPMCSNCQSGWHLSIYNDSTSFLFPVDAILITKPHRHSPLGVPSSLTTKIWPPARSWREACGQWLWSKSYFLSLSSLSLQLNYLTFSKYASPKSSPLIKINPQLFPSFPVHLAPVQTKGFLGMIHSPHSVSKDLADFPPREPGISRGTMQPELYWIKLP